MDGVFHYLGHHRMAYMADMDPSACGPCHVNDIFGCHILRPYIMRIQKVSDLLVAGSSFFCLCLFLPLQHLSEFLTVEAAKRIIGLEYLQCLSYISHVDSGEQIAVRAGKSFECRYAAVMQVHKIIHIILYRSRLTVIISDNTAP